MKKSTKILIYGILISILYILICLYIYNRDKIKKEPLLVPNISNKQHNPQNIEHKTKTPLIKSVKTDLKSKPKKEGYKHSILEYKIENGVITIAGNMPLLDSEDKLKKSMMRLCSEEYCDRTIVFSADREMPKWKDFAKEVIDFFYEENLTDASFEADEYGNIDISGELLTQRSQDRINQIIKDSNISNITNHTSLKLLRLENINREGKNESIANISKENKIIENRQNSNLEENSTLQNQIAKAQEQISKLLVEKKIHFYRNKAKITYGSKRVLNEIIRIIKDIPDVKVIVKGYTDASGEREINQWISSERAKRVKNYLGSHGINPKDITAQGFGEDDLLYPNKPYSPLNRRVEIEIERK